jgi:membrane-associated progesterone receptor component
VRYCKRNSASAGKTDLVRVHRSVFAGKDASRALAQSSLKPEDCRPDWYDLSDEHKKVLNDWFTFFSKRYNVKGKVEGATNTGE